MKRPFLLLLICYFVYLAYQVLSSNYVLSDEADMLWNRGRSRWVFYFWHIQGRSLTGWLESWLFSLAGTFRGLRYIRLISLLAWGGVLYLLYSLFRRLQRSGGYFPSGADEPMIFLTLAFTAGSFFTLISIGWAVCVEIPFAMMAALGAGRLLLLRGAAARVGFGARAGFVVLSLVSLFLYQTCYPIILLPFYMQFLTNKDGRWTRPMLTAIGWMFAVLLLYFGLFRLGLYLTGDAPAARTALGFDPIGRISFFFSYPMNQAFLAVVFFDTRSAFSQSIFPVMLLGWFLYIAFRQKGSRQAKLWYVPGMFGWWMLGFLPQLIASENHAGYRTMCVLGIMVFMMMIDVLLSFVAGPRRRLRLTAALSAGLLCWGGGIYYCYLARPLSYEFAVLSRAVRQGYHPGIKRVDFVLADEDGFAERFHVRHFKDEFGMPSSFKSWFPKPMIQQEIFELTGVYADSLEVRCKERPDSLRNPAAWDEMYINARRLW